MRIVIACNVAELWWPLGMPNRDYRAEALADLICNRKEVPDAVCLQEVWRRKAYRIFAKAAQDMGLDCHWHKKAGLVTMVKANDANSFEDFGFKKHYDWPFTHKGFTVAHTPEGTIVNTHMQAGFPRIIRNIFFRGVNFDSVKLRQLAQITDYLMHSGEEDIWVCGDFNLATNKPHEYDGTVALMHDVLHLHDLLQDADPQPAKRVDYIWGVPDYETEGIVDTDVMEEELTDHPLVMVMAESP